MTELPNKTPAAAGRRSTRWSTLRFQLSYTVSFLEVGGQQNKWKSRHRPPSPLEPASPHWWWRTWQSRLIKAIVPLGFIDKDWSRCTSRWCVSSTEPPSPGSLFAFHLPHSAMKNSSKTSRNIYCKILGRSGSTEKFMALLASNSCGPLN